MKKKKKEKKIVILGSYNSGKTTTLENICEKTVKVDYQGTTIALDYGNTLVKQEKVHIFASPGQERFRFMRKILSKGLDGAIVVIDSKKGLTSTDQAIINNLNSYQVPYVIFANKQDLKPGDLDHDGITDVPIIPTVAKEGEGIHTGLEQLLELVKIQGN